MGKPDTGASAEYLFASEMLARGIVPSWPSVETGAYDMIIDTGAKLYRVQVKGTNQTEPNIKFQFRRREGKKTKAYSKDEVDFIVLWLDVAARWYIFPVAATKSTMCIKPYHPGCKYKDYLDGWHLLG